MKVPINLKSFKKVLRNFNHFSNGFLEGEIELDLPDQVIWLESFELPASQVTLHIDGYFRPNETVSMYFKRTNGSGGANTSADGEGNIIYIIDSLNVYESAITGYVKNDTHIYPINIWHEGLEDLS